MLGVAIGDWQDRDFQNGLGVLTLDALGFFRRADPRGQRIARIEGHVGHGSPLEALGGASAALRVDIVRAIAVLLGIGIDDAANGAVILGQLGLQTPPADPIAGDDDLPLHRNTHALQGLVVIRHSEVHIDQVPGDIAVSLESHIGREFILGAAGGGVARHRGFRKGRLERSRSDHFQVHRQRRGIQDLEGLDPGVPAPGLELVEDPFSITLAGRRAHMAGLTSQSLHPVDHFGIGYLGVERLFPRRLRHDGP